MLCLPSYAELKLVPTSGLAPESGFRKPELYLFELRGQIGAGLLLLASNAAPRMDVQPNPHLETGDGEQFTAGRGPALTTQYQSRSPDWLD